MRFPSTGQKRKAIACALTSSRAPRLARDAEQAPAKVQAAAGKKVGTKRPRFFVSACGKFIYLDVLRGHDEDAVAEPAARAARASARKTASDPQLLATLRAAIDGDEA